MMRNTTPLSIKAFSAIGLLLLGSLLNLQAQNTKKAATVKGKITDQQTNAPLGYATVRVFKNTDSTLAGGGISDEKGQILVEVGYGQYYALVEFIGYKSLIISPFAVSKDQPTHDLGILKMAASARTLDEVVVQAEKSSMELSLDKKIFNVGKDLSNAGGTAIDILGNIPSVSVDTDGDVKLRGSDGVRILIDGKPSGLVSFKGGAGLQQLQGNQIEKSKLLPIHRPATKPKECRGLSILYSKKSAKTA